MLLRLNIKQPQLTASVHFASRFQFPCATLKGNDATLFALFKPFIFVVFLILNFFFLFFLNHCKLKLRDDIIQMCQSYLVCVGGLQPSTYLYGTADKTNHCYYYGTVRRRKRKKNKQTLNAPQLICGQLAVWSQSWTLSLILWEKPQVVNVSHRCIVYTEAPPPSPSPPPLPAPSNISSDVQYKPQTLPSKHPTQTSLRRRRETIRND